MKKNPTWKRMRCVFFLQTSKLHPNFFKKKVKMKKIIFIIKNIIKTENT